MAAFIILVGFRRDGERDHGKVRIGCHSEGVAKLKFSGVAMVRT